MDSTMTNEPGTIAFILYRQHHQAAVVAQHPGLPNPEISKILGEQWRNLPSQTKKKWQALAEVSSTFVPQPWPLATIDTFRPGRESSSPTAVS
jgi:HMG box factor